MRFIFYLAIYILVLPACQSQTKDKRPQKTVGGPCEGCEAIHEYGNRQLSSIDTLPGYLHNQPKVHISGTIYQNDGITPAKDIILYIYHTNRDGIYAHDPNANGWAQRHGNDRGWVRTDRDGKYQFYTYRPASYPNTTIPEHIHMTVKEPGLKEYYIDDILFDDDPNLTPAARRRLSNRGGSGIVTPKMIGNHLNVQRDIILGKHIPNYN